MDVLTRSAAVESRAAVALTPPRPLLPPMLAAPAAYLGLWTLPAAILLALNLEGYWVVAGNMDQAQHETALILGLAGVTNVLAGILAFVEARRQVRRVAPRPALRWWWGVPAICAQTAYLWLACTNVDAVLPPSVTAWIYPPERFLFNQFAFAMLPLFHGIIQVACGISFRRAGDRRAVGFSIALAVGAPLLLYIGGQLLRFASSPGTYAIVAIAATFVMLGLATLVGVVRISMLVLRCAQNSGRKVERIAIVTFAIVLPYAGLATNRWIPFPEDFQAWEVYALVAANAAILLLASWKQAEWPRLSFNLVCAAFPFSLYFFLVLLPYTPLSILAVVFFGLGFLVLTPTLLFVLHLHVLNRAWPAAVAASGRRSHALLAGVLCFLALPAFFTARGMADRIALHAALDHVFTPSVEGATIRFSGDRSSLRHALAGYRSFKDGIHYPWLSDFYNWIVFDSLVLPDDKLGRLEQTFFGAVDSGRVHDPLRRPANAPFGRTSVRDRLRMPRAIPVPRTVEVAALTAEVHPASPGNTICTLEFTLRDTGTSVAEYRQLLPLPPGVFVNGFRLSSGGVSVPGRIFEKKTALWVYTMIRDRQRRDPALLTYDRPGELELRVFPVTPGVLATVQLDLLLPAKADPARLPVESRDPAACLLALGRQVPAVASTSEHGTCFVAGTALDSVPRLERTPYLHLIIDRSEGNGFRGDLRQAIRTLEERFPSAKAGRLTLVNYDIVDVQAPLVALNDLGARDASHFDRLLPRAGGCALELAIAHALCLHRDLDLDGAAAGGPIPGRPVIVILSHKAERRSVDPTLTERWSDLAPDMEIAELGENATFVIHRSPVTRTVAVVRTAGAVRPVTAETASRFPAREASARLEYWWPQQAVWRRLDGVVRQSPGTPWASAADLALREQDHARSPGSAGADLAALVKRSRETGVLLPVTSYIAVENEAQWRTLELSERQKLGQNTALEFRETPAPPALLLAAAFCACLAVRRWRPRTGCTPGWLE